jgi:hypothetical protein
MHYLRQPSFDEWPVAFNKVTLVCPNQRQISRWFQADIHATGCSRRCYQQLKPYVAWLIGSDCLVLRYNSFP